MLPLLTKYLVNYGKVCIPHIGTFELVQESPRLDVADQQVLPPKYIARLINDETISDHQVNFLSSTGRYVNSKKELLLFGESLREFVRLKPVQWKGLGQLSFHSNQLLFEPDKEFTFLDPVPARKVIRENARHQVLVGDKEIISQELQGEAATGRKRIPWYIITGWVLLGISVLLILYFIYQGNFNTSSSGLKTKWW